LGLSRRPCFEPAFSYTQKRILLQAVFPRGCFFELSRRPVFVPAWGGISNPHFRGGGGWGGVGLGWPVQFPGEVSDLEPIAGGVVIGEEMVVDSEAESSVEGEVAEGAAGGKAAIDFGLVAEGLQLGAQGGEVADVAAGYGRGPSGDEGEGIGGGLRGLAGGGREVAGGGVEKDKAGEVMEARGDFFGPAGAEIEGAGLMMDKRSHGECGEEGDTG
jgi:hypothetical protein